jgi:Htaa
MTLSLRRLAGATALSALALLAVASGSHAAVSGSVGWTQAAVYELAAPPDTNRTWLGYVTGGPPLAAGAATASAGATGDPVTTSSPRGAGTAYTFGFPISSVSYDAATGSDIVEATGTVTFTSTAHGFTISVSNPRIVVDSDGTTGQLFASGVNAGGTYDRSQPLFDLDLSAATTSTRLDGTRVITGIVPSLASANWAFPSTYAVGAGPDRTPNTFGAFSLTLSASAGAEGPAGPQGPAGPTGPAGPRGPKGERGRRGAVPKITCRTRFVKRKPRVTCKVGKGNARKVRLSRNGRTFARGTVTRGAHKVTLEPVRRVRPGAYKLRVGTTTKRVLVG